MPKLFLVFNRLLGHSFPTLGIVLVNHKSLKRRKAIQAGYDKEYCNCDQMRLPLACFHVLFITGGQNNANLHQRMTKARFLWRVAFLCNLCYLISIYLRMHPSSNYGAAQSTVLIMGTLLAFVLNLLSLILLIIAVNSKREGTKNFLWLPVANLVVFIVQLIDLIY